MKSFCQEPEPPFLRQEPIWAGAGVGSGTSDERESKYTADLWIINLYLSLMCWTLGQSRAIARATAFLHRNVAAISLQQQQLAFSALNPRKKFFFQFPPSSNYKNLSRGKFLI